MTSKKSDTPLGRAKSCCCLALPKSSTYLKLCPVCHRNYPLEAVTCELDGSRLHRVCVTAESPQIGQVVGGIELRTLVALGNSSEVWEGARRDDGRLVIVKLLHFQRHDMEAVCDLCSRFFREAAAVSAIGHPNIVTLLDHGLDPATGQAFLVFEHLTGETLVDASRRWRMPRDFSVALEVSIQITEGLRQVHQLGIIHRDLKPSNIFLSLGPAGVRVKILDFGLAKIRNTPHLATLTRDMAYGTPAYLSPEQARGEEPDEATDIYCLGVLMFELFTGKLPFTGKPMRLILAHLQKSPPDPILLQPELPPPLAQVILTCMAKDKKSRYHDMAQLQTALRACVLSTPVRQP